MSESPDDTQAPFDTKSSSVDETGHSRTQTNSNLITLESKLHLV